MSTKQRCTHRQRDVLVEYMVANPEFARAEQSLPELDAEWLTLKEMLRDLGPDKTVLAWKRTWRELKKKACIKSIKKSKAASRDRSPMRDIDTKILSVIVDAPENEKSMASSNSFSYSGNISKETDTQEPSSQRSETDDFVNFFLKNSQLLKCGIIQFKLETDLKTERSSILRQQNELLKKSLQLSISRNKNSDDVI